LSDDPFYYTIEKPSVAEFKDRGSKFIAFAFPFSSKNHLKEQTQWVKAQHPKATHYCFAYRIRADGSEFRVSDDGEPAGTAGRPILGQIDSKKLTNILVIVVRYFGGSLLGVPGLIHAYKTATSLALQTTSAVRKQVELNYQLSFDYTVMNEVMMIVKQYRCKVVSHDLRLFCIMEIGIPKSVLEEVIGRLIDIRSLEYKKSEGLEV
jgi:uncharacterized YigZ family protein